MKRRRWKKVVWHAQWQRRPLSSVINRMLQKSRAKLLVSMEAKNLLYRYLKERL